ncbi:carboxyltransferase domain-containing protein, partial [Herbaspirillum sp. B65]|uniref:carboxyltransferase domain-containing protein n=1 Tax=Herbaspirillum sp. B65 TaxID=137708 RepID=UPI0005C8008D
MQPPHLHPLGDRALLCSLPAPATLPQQQRIWALAELAGSWDEVSEVVPGMNNLTLITKRPVADLDSLEQRITKTWPTLGGDAAPP